MRRRLRRRRLDLGRRRRRRRLVRRRNVRRRLRLLGRRRSGSGGSLWADRAGSPIGGGRRTLALAQAFARNLCRARRRARAAAPGRRVAKHVERAADAGDHDVDAKDRRQASDRRGAFFLRAGDGAAFVCTALPAAPVRRRNSRFRPRRRPPPCSRADRREAVATWREAAVASRDRCRKDRGRNGAFR